MTLFFEEAQELKQLNLFLQFSCEYYGKKCVFIWSYLFFPLFLKFLIWSWRIKLKISREIHVITVDMFWLWFLFFRKKIWDWAFNSVIWTIAPYHCARLVFTYLVVACFNFLISLVVNVIIVKMCEFFSLTCYSIYNTSLF